MHNRAISIIAKCSHGSVHQKKAMLRDEEEQRKLKESMGETQEPTVVFPEISKPESMPQV